MRLIVVKDKKQRMILSMLYYVLFIGFFTSNFGVPESAYYLLDVLLVLLLFFCISGIPKMLGNKEIKNFQIFIFSLILSGTVSAFIQGFDLKLWMWAIRNWGRMILFFYLCFFCMKKRVAERTIIFFVGLYDVNTSVILIQYLFFRSRYGADQLNGLFGRTTSGINVTVTLFVFCIVLSQYFCKKTSVKRVLATIAEIGFVAVVAELRAVFVFLILLVMIYVFLNLRLSVRQIFKYIFMACMVFAVMAVAAKYLVRIYPQFEGFFNIKRIIADASIEGGYGYTGYIDRLNAIPVINKYFFNNTGIWNKLFGIGIGNAEYSAFNFLTSDFYRYYGNTFRYLNFTSSVMYLEVGICGLALYVLAFASLLIKYVKGIKKTLLEKNIDQLFYENIGLGAAVISMIYIIYNNLQRSDGGIILAFFLALPIIGRRESKNEKTN